MYKYLRIVNNKVKLFYKFIWYQSKNLSKICLRFTKIRLML